MMPARSKVQQQFMGVVKAYKAGQTKGVSDKVKKAAMGMSMKQVDDFAGTPTAALPERIGKTPLMKRSRKGLPKVRYI